MAITIDLSGKHALVTGGTRGIGRAISRRLTQAGARVGMIYRSDSSTAYETVARLKETAPLDHFAIQADIAEENQASGAVAEAIQRFGGTLDILVMNAASGSSGSIAETSIEDWTRSFGVNVHGHVYVARAAYTAMNRGGSIIFISSGAGHDPISGLGAYGASKAAVNHLAAVMAQEWGPKGVRVNIVSPGHTAMKPVNYDHLTEKQKGIAETTALRRLGTPDDVANAVLLFTSDLAGFVTGQYLRVNGGRV